MKLIIKALMAVLATLFMSLPAKALELHSIEWTELIDVEAQNFEDPYRDLTEDQINQLRMIFQSREKLAGGAIPAEEKTKLKNRISSAEDAFAAAGIDADWLISQRWIVAGKRENAANAGNPALDDQKVSIAGFAIPAPPDNDGTSSAYLVELPGMCSHNPPPPPNQLIKVRLPNGWEPSYMHQPVRIKGQLHKYPSKQVFRVVDGDVAMKATWQLDADEVEDFKSSQQAKPENSEWIRNIRAKFLAKQTISD